MQLFKNCELVLNTSLPRGTMNWLNARTVECSTELYRAVEALGSIAVEDARDAVRQCNDGIAKFADDPDKLEFYTEMKKTFMMLLEHDRENWEACEK
jgi:hypothetical protein